MGGWQRLVRGAAGVLLLAVAARDVRAQEESDLESELFFAPAETVTSATRHIQPVLLSPSAVTVLTREDIEASGARTLPEALRQVPNMDVHLIKPLWSPVGVRGRTTGASDSMLLLIDGRDATMEFFGWPLWKASHVSIDEVERIEVIRGPGSALYGANAYAGVVHIITRKAGEGPRASAAIRGGEHGVRELDGRGTGRIGPVSLALSAGSADEGLLTAREGGGRRLLRGRLDARIELGKDHQVVLEAGALRASGTMYSVIGDVDLSHLINVYGRVRWALDSLVVQAVYDRYDIDADMHVPLTYGDLELARVPPVAGNQNKLSLQAQHGVDFFHNRLTYGGEVVHNFYHVEVLVDPDQGETRGGVFLQDEVDLSGMIQDLWETPIPPLILTVGLRVDGNTVSDTAFSPRASVVFSPDEDHSLRLGYAHAFLKPTFFQTSVHLRLDDVNGLGFDDLDLGNPDLRNQTIDSLEFGYQGGFLGGRILLRLDLAYNWYRNDILFELDASDIPFKNVGGILVPDINSPVLHPDNVPGGHNGHNVELQLITRPLEGLRLFANVGYRQMFSTEDGSFHSFEPVWRIATGVDARFPRGWSFSARAFYSSPFDTFITDPASLLAPRIDYRVPAHWIVTARVATHLNLEPFRLAIGLEGFNLTGTRIRVYAGQSMPNAPDFGGERLDRRVIFFLHGEL